MTSPTVRWASTWSGPFWASSSITKIAICGQYLLRLTASTNRPERQVVAGDTSLRGGRPGVVPFGVVFAETHDHELRQIAVLSRYSRNSSRKTSTLSVSRRIRPLAWQFRSSGDMADEPRHTPFDADVPSGWLTRPPYSP